MKVALVHDWLTGLRGGEKCLEAFTRIYPDADIFTLVHQPGSTSARLDERVHRVSFLNRIPGASSKYRLFLPLFPRAARSFSFEGYDLVISLSHAAVKNIVVPEGVPHLCYCFTPMRYIWDQAWSYLGALTPLAWPLITHLREWDVAGSDRVSHFIAISRFVAARIRRFYHRQASVIFPPVDTSWITPATPGSSGEAFLYAGALVPYKRVDVIISAFNRLGERLWIVGDGPQYRALRRAAGPNIEFMGRVDDPGLAEFYRRSRALVFPAREDFGMVPVESLAAGRPVIALGSGGCRDTIAGIPSWEPSAYNRASGYKNLGDQYLDNKYLGNKNLGNKNSGNKNSNGPSGVFFSRRQSDSNKRLMRQSDGEGAPKSDLSQGVEAAVRFFIENEAEFSVENCVKRAAMFSPAVFEASWNELLQSLERGGEMGFSEGGNNHLLTDN